MPPCRLASSQGVTDRRVVGVEAADEITATDRLYQILDVQEHDMSGPAAMLGVVAVLLTAIDQMVRGRIVGHEPEGILVAGIGQVTPLQEADDGDAEVVDSWIESQSLIGVRLLLIVVQMCIPRIPPLRWQIGPSFEMQLDLHGPFRGHGNDLPKGFVLRATLNHDVRRTTRHVHGELPRTVEERVARTDLQDAVSRVDKVAAAGQDMDLRLDGST